MPYFSSLLFGVSASLDSLLVGLSYGIRRVPIRLWQNLFIGLVTLSGTCLSIGAGHLLTPFLPGAVCRYTGSLILILLGSYYIVRWLIRPPSGESRPEEISPDRAADLPEPSPRPSLAFAEVFGLSLTLSLNNLGIGLSASLAGLALLPTAAATLFSSVFLLFLGNRLGRCRLLRLAGRAADPVSGFLLVGLGLIQLIW